MPNDTRYRVWRPDHDETEWDAANRGWHYDAFDERSAAEHHAMFCHNTRDGWEWSWPVVFRVKDLATGKEYDIEVERHTVPAFEAGKPKEVTHAAQAD